MNNGALMPSDMPMQEIGQETTPYRPRRGAGIMAGSTAQAMPAELNIPTVLDALDKVISMAEGNVYGLEEKLYPILSESIEKSVNGLAGETPQPSKVIERLVNAIQRIQNMADKTRQIQGRVQL